MPKKTKTYTQLLPACKIPVWMHDAVQAERDLGISTGQIMRGAIDALFDEPKMVDEIILYDDSLPLSATMPSTMVDKQRSYNLLFHKESLDRSISQAIRDALLNYFDQKGITPPAPDSPAS